MVVGLAALAALALLGGSAGAEMAWRDARTLTVEGRGWQDTEGPWDRLPARGRTVAPQLMDLARHSAGVVVRLRTDARQVAVRWRLSAGELAMPHMPSTGVSGVDVYRRAAGGWEFVRNCAPGGRESAGTVDLGDPGSGAHEIALYLPLYNGVERLEVGASAGSRLEAAEARAARPIVFYGTSIVQGGCASRPGMAHVAILGRMLDRPVVNLGFSGSALMEPAVSGLLSELDPALYVIDCLWNMTGLGAAEVKARVGALIQTIRRAHPGTPILFVGQSLIRRTQHPTGISVWQREAVEAARHSGIRRLSLVGGERLLGGDDEGTVDGVHPNDLGMMRQAETLLPAIRRALAAGGA